MISIHLFGPFILSLGTNLMWVVSFTPGPPYCRGRRPRYLWLPQPVRLKREKSLAAFEYGKVFLRFSAQSLFAILTTLSRLCRRVFYTRECG